MSNPGAEVFEEDDEFEEFEEGMNHSVSLFTSLLTPRLDRSGRQRGSETLGRRLG
jgi:hypothetical protein